MRIGLWPLLKETQVVLSLCALVYFRIMVCGEEGGEGAKKELEIFRVKLKIYLSR